MNDPGQSRASQIAASVIIVAFNGAAVLPACLEALRGSADGAAFELIVVDNGSSDGSPELVERAWPGARVIRNGRNLGFGSGNNVGIRAARGEALLLLNQDTEPPLGWVGAMVEALKRHPKAGAIGCKLVYPDRKTIQHAGGVLYANGLSAHTGMGEPDDGRWDESGVRTYVTAAAMALRRAVLEQVGLFDPGFDPGYYEEVDLQMRLWAAGWEVVYEPGAGVVHHESQVLGAGRAATVALITRHRLRYLALHGLPGGVDAAARLEWAWLGDMARKGRLGAALWGYATGGARWIGWRMDRGRRGSVERLGDGE